MKKKKSRKSLKSRKSTKHKNIPIGDLKAILVKAKSGALSDDEIEKLDGAVDTLATLTNELEMKGASIRNLRRLLFGSGTEKTQNILKEKNQSADNTGPKQDESKSKDKKVAGHGRLSADKYKGAEKISIKHESLKHGDSCPECLTGKVYRQKKTSPIVRITGVAPLEAIVYDLEQYRCGTCGKVFTASAPDNVGKEKYDDSAAAMIALLKYSCGLPFNRLDKLQKNLGIPLPNSTQWDIVKKLAKKIIPIYAMLIRFAADGDLLHNDDTTTKILDLEKEIEKQKANASPGTRMRTGIFTTGIVSIKEQLQIALFFSGRKHAGENLETVLSQRNEELSLPIQMSDALSSNTTGIYDTIEANCNSHARRKFVEVVEDFPEEVRFVLKVYKEIYKHDALTKLEKMSDDQRLEYHKKHSKPEMDKLYKWLIAQFEEKLVEPNSTLGNAIQYTQNHWEKLTQFLKIPGAPLDNNICERILKQAIIHRKNSLFFKTENGAKVGDLFMSLIFTCELQKVSPFDYMTKIATHAAEIAENPENWMPWNYLENNK